MMDPIHLALVIHFHQPVGNFDEVFVQAHDRCYAPLLDTVERSGLPFTLHFTGPLLEWLAANRPDYLERVRALVAADRVELLGGGFYEPILPTLPPADREGQLQLTRRWLEDRFGHTPRGCWLAERVWQPGLTGTLADAGLEYTLLDDHLIRSAGFDDTAAMRPFLVEDGGRLLRVLPISEKLRYLIPFGGVEELIAELDRCREEGGRLLLYGDDAEKFGLWPGTHEHVYGERWLERAWRALAEAGDRIRVVRAGDLLALEPPTPTHVPPGSYREMEEWAAPRTRPTLVALRRRLAEDPECGPAAEIYLRGGAWQNFFHRYTESRRLHGRACAVSAKLRQADPLTADAARPDLYRAQCNCSYWHGVFGGIYLTHLRDNLYRHLLRAEGRLDRALGLGGDRASRERDDFDLDGRLEIALGRGPLKALIKPDLGGRLYEFSHLEAAWNPLLSLARRREAYHDDLTGEQLAANPLVEDPRPRDCLVERLVTALPGAATWPEEPGPGSLDLGADPWQETWEGDLLLLSRRVTWTGGCELEVGKRLELDPEGLTVTWRVTARGGPPPAGWLAVECSVGPGNQGGDSLIASPTEGWPVAEPGLRPAPERYTAQGITRGDVEFIQAGADTLHTGPIWALSRDEEEIRRDLQGTTTTLFFPLADASDREYRLRIALHPWS